MFLFFDVETTGLPVRRNAPLSDLGNWPRVVSAAYCIAGPDRRTRVERNFIVKPKGFSIPPDASRIHGITDAIARSSGVPFSEVATQLLSDLRTFAVSQVVAHNLEFDKPILSAEFLRLGLEAPFAGLSDGCTMRIAAQRLGWTRVSLADACRRFLGREPDKAHDALADVRACRDLFFALRPVPIPAGATAKVLKSSGTPPRTGGPGLMSIDELIEIILAKADERPGFDPSFVEEMQERLLERGYLTDSQEAALWNIAERWHFI